MPYFTLIRESSIEDQHMSKIECKRQGQKVLEALHGLAISREDLIGITKQMLSAYKGTMYPLDLFALGAVKRSLSTLSGFTLLVKSWNMICARALLRTQLDTAMRFYASFLVDDPHEFAMNVIRGKQINKMKDREKQLMTDAYLVSRMSDELPWLPIVYKNLSGYIHLSASHMNDSVQNYDDDSCTISLSLTDEDSKFPVSSWCEMIACFNEAIGVFIEYLKGWTFTKGNPELVYKMKRERNMS